MTNSTKLTALTFAVLASALSLGTAPASAAGCDGSWVTTGHTQKQCYYLPTVSNGRVTGLEYKENTRALPAPVVVHRPVQGYWQGHSHKK